MPYTYSWCNILHCHLYLIFAVISLVDYLSHIIVVQELDISPRVVSKILLGANMEYEYIYTSYMTFMYLPISVFCKNKFKIVEMILTNKISSGLYYNPII